MEQQKDISIPHDQYAECRLLGNLIEVPEKYIDQVLAELEPDDFFLTAHRKIFSAMIEVKIEHNSLDFVALADKLQINDHLESIGGIAYLAELIDPMNLCCSVSSCVKKIKETAIKRKTLRASELISSLASDPSISLDELSREVAKATTIVNEQSKKDCLPDIQADLLAEIADIEARINNPSSLLGLPTGFHQLDYLTAGLQPTDLIIIGAYTGKGKSAIALNIAQAVCSIGKSVAFFSLEMTRKQLYQRLLCSIAEVNLHLIRTGLLNKNDCARLMEACQKASQYKLIIDDRSVINPAKIRAHALRVKEEKGLDLIILDYLQLAKPDVAQDARYLDVGSVAHELKAIAKDLQVPLVALAQVNKETEKRADQKPMMSDLRESGNIAQDADLVCLLHPIPQDPRNDNPHYQDTDLIIAKQRNGPLGTVPLVFAKEFTKFLPRTEY